MKDYLSAEEFDYMFEDELDAYYADEEYLYQQYLLEKDAMETDYVYCKVN